MNRVVALVIVSSAAVLATGCGKKGSPVAPVPRGPRPPEAVAVRQVGPDVVVRFTVPESRGDRPSQEPRVAELVRVALPPGQPSTADPDAFRRRGELAGLLEGDPLAAGVRAELRDDTAGGAAGRYEGWSLRYGVRVRDRKGRASTLVATDEIVPLSPRPGPTGVSAVVASDGVRLIWSAPDGGERLYNVYRATDDGPFPETPIHGAPLASTEFVDTDARSGETYRYVVRELLGDGAPVREGPTSPEVRVEALDRQAPSRPVGVIGVQEAAAARLFWDPNSERDVAGYRVYRRVGDEPWSPVPLAEIRETLFLDVDVRVGQRIAYRVAAFDRAEPPNESEPSEEAIVVVAPDPGGRP